MVWTKFVSLFPYLPSITNSSETPQKPHKLFGAKYDFSLLARDVKVEKDLSGERELNFPLLFLRSHRRHFRFASATDVTKHSKRRIAKHDRKCTRPSPSSFETQQSTKNAAKRA